VVELEVDLIILHSLVDLVAVDQVKDLFLVVQEIRHQHHHHRGILEVLAFLTVLLQIMVAAVAAVLVALVATMDHQ
jgi:hypothetical protein